MHANTQRVVDAAAERGLHVEIRSFPEGTRTAEDAAAAIGCEVAQIVKSLVFLLDDKAVMALVAGSNRLDEAKLAAALGGGRVNRADADAVRAATGFPIGGVSPLGHTTDLRVVVDRDLLDHEVVWAAAGTPRDVFALTPAELVKVSGGTVAELKKDP